MTAKAGRKGELTLTEIADRINEHLRRMERDPKINRTPKAFYCAGAWNVGRWIRIRYVSHQEDWMLHPEEAERYLAWLDGGNNGEHFRMADEKSEGER